jgi:CheY-like chemotaxis protein
VLTASDKDQDINECRRLGASAFITKPVSFHGLSKVTPELCLVWALIKPLEISGAI